MITDDELTLPDEGAEDGTALEGALLVGAELEDLVASEAPAELDVPVALDEATRLVPSIAIAAPHFLQLMRARRPATFSSGTLKRAAQAVQVTSMDEQRVLARQARKSSAHLVG